MEVKFSKRWGAYWPGAVVDIADEQAVSLIGRKLCVSTQQPKEKPAVKPNAEPKAAEDANLTTDNDISEVKQPARKSRRSKKRSTNTK